MNPDNPTFRTEAECSLIIKLQNEIKQLKADLRTSDLNRQSLWVDSLKLVDEITALKSKLAKAIEKLRYVSEYLHDGHIVDDLLSEIGEG